MEESEKKTVSSVEFNAAKAYEYTLMIWLEECNQCAMDEDYHGWFKALRNVYKIVECKMDDKEKPKSKTEFIELIKSCNEYKSRLHNSINQFTTSFPDKLFKMEIILRNIANNHDMLNPDKKGFFDEDDDT